MKRHCTCAINVKLYVIYACMWSVLCNRQQLSGRKANSKTGNTRIQIISITNEYVTEIRIMLEVCLFLKNQIFDLQPWNSCPHCVCKITGTGVQLIFWCIVYELLVKTANLTRYWSALGMVGNLWAFAEANEMAMYTVLLSALRNWFVSTIQCDSDVNVVRVWCKSKVFNCVHMSELNIFQ